LFENSRPTDGAIATEMFVREIIRALLSERQIQNLRETRIFVGHPSGWNDSEVDAYRELLGKVYGDLLGPNEAGLHHVSMVPESRAAFFHARESGETSAKVSMDELERKVLIMDFGSSTADFTATVGLEAKPLDFGHISLGAGIIDELGNREGLRTLGPGCRRA
jgi:hypothetical protein